MDNKGLIFIPDISGFSRFVHDMEIEHSRLIIKELLEILIDANRIGLEISEIEGDAILFYKFGERPELEQVFSQVKEMFCTFHKNLLSYDNRRYCQCDACMSAINLTLKVITHYGEFTGYNVKTFNKLIGRDIIIAHQLLKNDIDNHEYWLVTEDLAKNNSLKPLAEWMTWNSSKKNTGESSVSYYYAQLAPLKNDLNGDQVLEIDLSEKIKVETFTKEYNTDIITLLHAAADFNYRNQWMEGVKEVEIESHFLPRVGKQYQLHKANGQITTISTTHYAYQDHVIEFSETDSSGNISFYRLEKTGDQKTRLTLDHYIVNKPFSKFLFNVMDRSKMRSSINRSLQNLGSLVPKIKLPRNSRGDRQPA